MIENPRLLRLSCAWLSEQRGSVEARLCCVGFYLWAAGRKVNRVSLSVMPIVPGFKLMIAEGMACPASRW